MCNSGWTKHIYRKIILGYKMLNTYALYVCTHNVHIKAQEPPSYFFAIAQQLSSVQVDQLVTSLYSKTSQSLYLFLV